MLHKSITPLAKTWLKAAILFVLVLLIRFIQLYPQWIEEYYSITFFQKIAELLRLLAGWVPFSAGDILYAMAIIWLLIKIILLLRKKFSRNGFLQGLGVLVSRILLIYIIFNFLWGLNYYRLGISYQLQLQPDSYNITDLKELTSLIINKANAARRSIGNNSFSYTSNKEIFEEAQQCYKAANNKYPFLAYKNRSVKSSLYGKLGNYMGFLGYYNPFTGEAQLNVTPPSFILPYTTCHEIAHQIGYASEGEANFVGYLAAKESQEKLFQYSLYFDLYTYANKALFVRDSIAAIKNNSLLDTLVLTDMKAYRKFVDSYKNPLEPIITRFYGSYLKANNQPKGVRSYNDIVAWLIAYKKKYGDI